MLQKKIIKEHNPNWLQILGHPYRISIIGGSRSAKTKSLFNFINHQPHFDKIYLHGKNPYEVKYRFLINKRENAQFNDSKSFIEYLNDMDDIYKNI